MDQTGRSATQETWGYLHPCRYVLHDRDTKFCASFRSALASGGVIALAMGAVLMNYMGHYVGALAAASARPIQTMVIGWHPWAVIRVVSFVTIGVVLSGPVLSRIGGFRFDWRAERRFLLYAAIGLAADVVLKWSLAPYWRHLLLRVVGW